MATITLENMEFRAHHGVLNHEKELGNNFLITAILEVDTGKAGITDHLEDTINYALIYNAIKKQMELPSNLIEHVAERIADKLINKFLRIKELTLHFSKLNPPLSGKVERVTITLHRKRD